MRATNRAVPVVVAVLALLAWLGGARVASADVPQDGRLLVTADFVLPGQGLPLVGIDLAPGDVDVSISAGSTTATLGSARVAADGSLSASLPVPAGFPHGYAQVVAAGVEGRWETTVLIGPRAEGPGAVAPPGSIDARLLALGVLAIGLATFAVFGLRYLRR